MRHLVYRTVMKINKVEHYLFYFATTHLFSSKVGPFLIKSAFAKHTKTASLCLSFKISFLCIL